MQGFKLKSCAIILLAALAMNSCGSKQGEQQEEIESSRLKALIIDGQSNHPIFVKTTMMIKDYLEQTGLFDVDIDRTAYIWMGPHNDGFSTREARDSILAQYQLNDKKYTVVDSAVTDPDFSPDFSKYDLVVSNFGWLAAPWPASTMANFDAYVRNGGGVIIFHAANNSFGDSEEYNRIIGLGGWGGRDKTSGFYAYYDNDGKMVLDTAITGCGSHGPQSEYVVTLRDNGHPITTGMPERWMHSRDELYERLCGPAEDMSILATGYSDPVANTAPWAPDVPGTDRNEPVLLAIEYEKGRVFHSVMGHSDLSLECVGLMTALKRGAEWAATGEVSQAIPDDFPSDTAVSLRPWNR